MNNELLHITQQLAQAGAPEAVFGPIPGPDQAAALKQAYHRLAKITHPDRYAASEDQAAAQEAFTRLTAWYALAQAKVKAGLYGQDAGGLELRTKKRTYLLDGAYSESGPYLCYPGAFAENGLTYPVTVKLVRDPHDNDLAQNESRALQMLAHAREAKKFWPYVPRLLDSFMYEADGAAYQANVFERADGWYSLEAVRRAYPGGLDPRDMAWMWRRLLVALGFAHRNGLVHGAVLPGSVLILPEQHGLMLAEWSFSVRDPVVTGETIPAIDPAYASWYPPEVCAKEAPLPGTDIAMAAHCMVYLLGGGPVHEGCPAGVPAFLRAFFEGCTLPGKKSRPQDAWALLKEFDELIQRFWGERTFRPFVMQ